MSKYLNVDELVSEKKVLTLKGTEYEMHEVTVEEFINLMKASQDAPDFDQLPMHERIEKLIDQVLKAFPTIPPQDLRELTINQLTVIIKFVVGSLEEEAVAKGQAKKNQT